MTAASMVADVFVVLYFGHGDERWLVIRHSTVQVIAQCFDLPSAKAVVAALVAAGEVRDA